MILLESESEKSVIGAAQSGMLGKAPEVYFRIHRISEAISFGGNEETIN